VLDDVLDDSPVAVDLSFDDPLDDLSEAVPSELDPAPDLSFAADRAAAPRSFFAQPLPLKWIVGGANAFRTGPLRQTGQWVGPSLLTPWITSKRCPQ
jgi:hypothetical protein